MNKGTKLDALRRTYEIEEQKALKDKKRIEEVVEQRRRIVLELSIKREQIKARIRDLRSSERQRALQENDAGYLVSAATYEKRLSRELHNLIESIKPRQKELDKAMERGKAVDEEILEIRIEKKRIEKYLSNQEYADNIVDAATEEIRNEEMNYYRRTK